jgi:hypothetical protein
VDVALAMYDPLRIPDDNLEIRRKIVGIVQGDG